MACVFVLELYLVFLCLLDRWTVEGLFYPELTVFLAEWGTIQFFFIILVLLIGDD